MLSSTTTTTTRSVQALLLLWAAAVSTAFTPIAQPHYATTNMNTNINTRSMRNNKYWNSPAARHSFARILQATNDNNNNNEDRDNSSSPTTATTEDNVFDKALQDGKLGQAVNYLRDHPDMDVSRQRWDAIFRSIEETTASADESSYNMQQQQDNTNNNKDAIAEFPLQSAVRNDMTAMYRTLQQQDKLQLFGAVDTNKAAAAANAGVAVMPAAGSTDIGPDLLEEILTLPMKSLTPQPTNSLLLAGIAVAVAEAGLSVAFGVSLNALALATLFLTFVDRLFLNGAVIETFLKLFSPGINKKVLKHEAGHFLTAYLLGCPVEGIVLSAWAALADSRFGNRQVSAGTSFFDPDLSRQINTNGQVTRASIDRYSVIVMAGIAAEADSYGRADGGAGDEMALVAFLSQLNASSGGAAAWTSDKIRNQARWGALQAVLLLREYKPAYDALVDALERGGTLGDCVHAIERAAREHDLKPLQRPVGYIGSPTRDNVLGSWSTEAPAQDSSLLQSSVAVAAGTGVPKAVASKEFDEQESLETLKEYRTAVEQKLQKLDAQLNDIQD